MEESLKLEPTEVTPLVILSPAENKFLIKGRSLPEDAPKFYDQIQEYLNKYSRDPNSSTVFEFDLDYFNSASSKQILDMLTKLEMISKAGKDVKVLWYYHKDDDLMESMGEELKEMLEMPFELVSE